MPLLLLALLPCASAHAQISTDGSVGAAVQLTGPDFEIPASLGDYRGTTLFHSFDVFGVPAGGSAEFTPDGLPGGAVVDLMVGRVTGGAASIIDGPLRSSVGETSFLFVNPAGVVFGEGALLDVPGSFHVSTADRVEFSDGGYYSASDLAGSQLSVASPVAFGFLGAPIAPIEVRGVLEVGVDDALSITAGDIAIIGDPTTTLPRGLVSAVDGDLTLVAVASGGRVRGLFDPSVPVVAEGFSAFGDISILQDAIVSSSGISPLFRSVGGPVSIAPPPLQLSGQFQRVDGATDRLASVRLDLPDPGPADVLLGVDSAGSTFHLRPIGRGGEGAGAVRIIGRDLTIVDAEVRSVTAGDGDAGAIDVDLSGDLLIRRVDKIEDVGLLARSGFEITGSQSLISFADGLLQFDDVTLRIGGTGAGGGVRIDAANVRLEDGAQITATSLTGGRGGDVDIRTSGDLVVSGRSATGKRSAIFSNAESTGDGGDISIDAGGLVRVDAGGVIINQTSSDGDAGRLRIEADSIEILDGGKVDSSTSANSLSPSDPGTTSGRGGDLEIVARSAVTVAGRVSADEFARLGAKSEIRSTGDAGVVSVQTPVLVVRDGGALIVTTEGAGGGGGLRIDAGRVEVSGGGLLAAASNATRAQLGGAAPGAAGSIEVGVDGGVHELRALTLSQGRVSTFAAEGPPAPQDPADAAALREGNISFSAFGPIEVRDGSAVEASVGEGLGGSIRVATTDTLLVRDASALLARSISTDPSGPVGQGGRIELTAAAVLVSPDSSVDASAGLGVDGEVVINSPVSRIESATPILRTDFLDPSSLVRGACEARAAGAGGSLGVARVSGQPPSPDDALLAFAPLGSADERQPGARASIADGERALRRADVVSAEVAFDQARAAARSQADAAALVDALLGRAQAEQLRGRFRESIASLEQARAEAQRSSDDARLAASLGALSNALVATRDPDRAERLLVQAIAHASQAGDPVALAVLQNSLGNLLAMQGRAAPALAAHRAAADLGSEGPAAAEVRALARANAARSALAAGDPGAAYDLAVGAGEAAAATAPGRVRSEVGIHVARTWSSLAAAGHVQRDLALRAAHGSLVDAERSAREVGDERLVAHASGALAELYASERRTLEALELTRRAIRADAGSLGADGAWRWRAQEARLLWQLGRASEALAAWRRAVLAVDASRHEGQDRYGAPSTSFDREISPVYFDFVRALLDGADRVGDEAARDALLGEVRATVERYRAAELRDYFSDACATELASRTRDLDAVLAASSSPTAIVYPIVLPDRLELLVSLSGEIRRYTVDVPADEIERTSASFRRELGNRATRRHLRPARALYDWLVAPYAALLGERGVETLVFVPGGALRSIPMAALHDGERYLVERFATALAPGLSLVDARPLDPSDARFLLAGLSEAVDGFAPLPGVPREMAAIERRYGGEVLLDDRFEIARFEGRILEDQPAVVHVASHALFTGDPTTSFLLAHDGRLSFESFSKVMSRAQYGRQPVELLVLSACETAAGNDRASLGLAGLAVRSGARSAVGSLWSVSDDASTRLFEDFYGELQVPGRSKAEALRRAQRALIASPEFGHPFFWSAFLVVSNWM